MIIACGAAAVWSAAPGVGDLNARLAARLRAAHVHAVPLDSIARPLRDAVIATEDEHFYSEPGVDVLGLLRAIPYDLSHGTAAQGGSTITEQFAKLLYLGGNDHTPLRKLEDIALAVKLDQRYSRRQLLDGYLNTAYFGANAYGIAAASERYFGIPPGRLDLARASLLAGLIQAPSAFNPLQHPGAARARQVEVVRSLVRNQLVGVRAGRAALAEPLRLTSGRVLAPVRGHVALAPGATFDWREFGLGLVVVLLATGAAVLRWRRPLRPIPLGAVSIALMLFGMWAVIRSFRVA